MAYPKIRISLVAAQHIFSEAEIRECRDDNSKIIGYKAQAGCQTVLMDGSLTNLCKRLYRLERAYRTNEQALMRKICK